MRTIFLLIVFVNLVVFAYAQFSGESAMRARFSQLEVSPEKIRVIKATGRSAPDRPASETTGKSTAAAPAPAACMEWGVFAGPIVARADSALARLELPQDKVERSITDSGGYWVYVPPAKSKFETDRRIGELKALGVDDFFLVQDAGPWRNAISLGIFKTDEAAQDYLARLKERGVRSAVAERRENFLKQIVYLVREPDEATVARLAALQQEFPGSELKATACPAKG